MSVRIRYTKSDRNGIQRSKQTFKSSNGANYRVKIDNTNIMYYIINLNDNRTIKKGGEKITSLRFLKIAAKQALQSLGVNFDIEIRDNLI